MTRKKRLVILDSNAIVHRAYHAIPPLTAKDGTMINAVFGFVSMLLKIKEDLKPDYLAASFDVSGPTFRDKIFDKYKAKRVKADQELYDQIPLVRSMLESLGIPVYDKEGFEADDIIGTIAERVKDKYSDLEVVAVTGDMDILQLIDGEKVKVFLLRRGLADAALFGSKEVKEKYGFEADKVIDYKTLRGDASDNIPGVPGIGEKTAVELLNKFGSVRELYQQIKTNKSGVREKIKPGVLKKLEEGEEMAKLSKELSTIKRNVSGLKFDLKDCEIKDFKNEKSLAFLRRLEFFSLIKRLGGAGATDSGAVTQKNREKMIEVTETNAEEFFKHFKQAKSVAIREIFTSKELFSADISCAALKFADKKEIYFLNWFKHRAKIDQAFDFFLSKKENSLIGHDLKNFVRFQKLRGKEIKASLFDVMVASYLINSGARAHGLSEIVSREFGENISSNEAQGNLFGPDPKQAALEVSWIFRAHVLYKEKLEKAGNYGLFSNMEMPLISVLSEMENNGVAIDEKKLAEISLTVDADIEKITKEIWKLSGEEFNVASSVQMRDVLFNKMKISAEGVKRGKTGLSTAASELEKLRDAHPIISLIEEHRELSKIKNTYVDVLPGLVNKKTGRVHTTFNQTATTTGRLSSSDPNLQNIPIRTDLGKKIRNAFVSTKGNNLLVADYSQIELRIVASLAKDEKLIEIFGKGEDIHKATAAAINDVPIEKVTKEMRSAAKEVNFGVLYGMGSYGLSWRAGISRGQAKDFIDKYFTRFAGVKKYIDETLKFAKESGYVETLFGRRRYIPELKSDNFQLRSAGERMAVNMPVQGTAADLMKIAMIDVYKYIIEEKDKIRLVLQVHDELVFEVKEDFAEESAKIIKQKMEGAVKLLVPVEVHVSIGKRWGDLK